MDSLTKQQQALFWTKYWDMYDENNVLKLVVNEREKTLERREDTIALLRRELVDAKNKIAKLEHLLDPVSFFATR